MRIKEKPTLLIRNIDIRIQYAAGQSDDYIAEMCEMSKDEFIDKWNEVQSQEEYLMKLGFKSDANDFMRNGIFSIKQPKQ